MRRPAGHVLVVPVLAAVLVAGFVTALIQRTPTGTHGSSANHPAAAGTTTRHPPELHSRLVAGGRPSLRAGALLAARQLLDASPVIPQSSRVRRAPDAVLRTAPISRVGAHRVDRHYWAIAPGPPDTVVRYFRSHVPHGVWSTAARAPAGPTAGAETTLVFTASGPRWVGFDPNLTSLRLSLAVTRVGAYVGIRVDATATWHHGRTVAETVPGSVSSVQVVVARPGQAATVRRTLGASAARRLGTLLNGLRPAPAAPSYCPIDYGDLDRLTFGGPHTDLIATIDVTGCRSVTMAADGVAQPYLHGTPAIDAAVLRAMRLPPRFGVPR